METVKIVEDLFGKWHIRFRACSMGDYPSLGAARRVLLFAASRYRQEYGEPIKWDITIERFFHEPDSDRALS